MKLVAAVVTVVVVTLGGTFLLKDGDPSSGQDAVGEGLTFETRRGNLRVTITEHGTLVAQDSQRITSGTRRRHEITYLIDEGEMVEEGTVLARLDGAEQERELEQLEIDIVVAETSLSAAETALEIQKSQNLSDIEKAKFTLEKASNELRKYEEGDAPNERRKLSIAVKQKETEFSRAKKRYEDSRLLFEQEFISKAQLEEDEIEFERATVERDSARLDVDIFEKYTLPMTRREKEIAVKDAERDLETSEKKALQNLRQKEVDVESAKKKLAKLNSQRDDTTEELEKCVVTAPAPGLVLYGDPEEPWYREDIKVGSAVHGRNTMFTIPDLRVMQVKMWIHEADINKLDEALPARITMDTYPGMALDGEISRIASIAGSPDRWDRNPEVKRFEVDVIITGESEIELKPGISAKAEIFIEEREDVLYVPIQSVFMEEGEHYCYVLEGGRPVRRAVEPGSGNDTHLEVMEGLEDGERVLLYNPNLATTGSEDEADETGSAADGSETDPEQGAVEP